MMTEWLLMTTRPIDEAYVLGQVNLGGFTTINQGY